MNPCFTDNSFNYNDGVTSFKIIIKDETKVQDICRAKGILKLRKLYNIKNGQ